MCLRSCPFHHSPVHGYSWPPVGGCCSLLPREPRRTWTSRGLRLNSCATCRSGGTKLFLVLCSDVNPHPGAGAWHTWAHTIDCNGVRQPGAPARRPSPQLDVQGPRRSTVTRAGGQGRNPLVALRSRGGGCCDLGTFSFGGGHACDDDRPAQVLVEQGAARFLHRDSVSSSALRSRTFLRLGGRAHRSWIDLGMAPVWRLRCDCSHRAWREQIGNRQKSVNAKSRRRA